MTRVAMFTYKSASLILNVWENAENTATISDLISKRPKHGHGTKLLMKVLRLCDTLEITTILEVVSGYPESMSDTKLQAFYSRFGFVPRTPGQRPVVMMRKPKK